MRHLIKNKKLAHILDIVEETLGYPIKAASLDSSDKGVYSAAVVLKNNFWELQYTNGTKISDDVLCHELLHIILFLEGWPLVFLHQRIGASSPERLLLCQIFDHLQHSVLWERVIKLGYTNEEVEEYKEFLQPGRMRATYLHYPQPLREKLRACMLQPVILLPMPELLKSKILGLASREIPAAYNHAVAINNSLSDFFPLNPQSYQKAIEKNIEMLSMPKDSLKCEFPTGTYPNLFEKICNAVI